MGKNVIIHKRVSDIGATGNLSVEGMLYVASYLDIDRIECRNAISCNRLDARSEVTAGNVRLTSDRRLKENIENISQNDKNKVLQLVPKTYNMINEKSKRYGLIAQEVEELYPELVSQDDKGMKSLNYIELIPLLLDKIKELNTIITTTLPKPDTINIDGVTLNKSELLKLKQLINQ
jgi:hypothetical protein